MPASVNASRAARWFSLSMSIVVELTAGGHAAEQVQPGHAGAGADLDDRSRLGGRGEHAQRGTAGRRRSATQPSSWPRSRAAVDDVGLGGNDSA